MNKYTVEVRSEAYDEPVFSFWFNPQYENFNEVCEDFSRKLLSNLKTEFKVVHYAGNMASNSICSDNVILEDKVFDVDRVTCEKCKAIIKRIKGQ